ncbi:unnamed protein product, partial [Vitis vinifera]
MFSFLYQSAKQALENIRYNGDFSFSPEYKYKQFTRVSLEGPKGLCLSESCNWRPSFPAGEARPSRLLPRCKGMRVPRSLEVWKMGTVNYLDALKLQDKLISRRKTHKISDTVLSLQHPPTYTLGKRRTDHNLLVPESDLKTIGAELHYTQRGGDITFHGPHQAILYPIISLRDIGLGARNYRKIGAIGVRISSGITSHGLAFNIDPDLNYFKHIVPCGIADKEVTSLRRETDLVLPTEEVIHEQLISCFARLFCFSDLIWKEDAPILPDNGEAE